MPSLRTTCARHQGTLFFVLRTGEDYFLLNIALHLPDVAGVSFQDVNGEKGHLAVVLLVEFIEGGNLPPEWRSRVAAEHQHDRSLRGERCQVDGAAFVLRDQPEVGRRIAGSQVTGPGTQPRGFKREDQERDRAGHMGHHPPEGLRRLTHGPPDESGEGRVQQHENCQNLEQKFLAEQANLEPPDPRDQ